ncbi:hypothetical protein JHN55_22730 [Streptomyces sp. MBT56]|uniref:hypothetical protein n=1 Tax=unclassified Streptomyces TaxID=2593676 RepID=UPI0019098B56|nr:MULTISPECIES: hypothetical protein [unclassified Streptomyces]MBK3559287.1 hypothetical protein [Streptomyces sp. MBT56]MBK3601010.1 hypothetical protein [Streptomyces sp. MBT54]MBK3613916.1 hypothetical protein [Streptomyces sp. MBT98]MBK6042019.1 hypothetical protein [Streptomyces sp. MBT55]
MTSEELADNFGHFMRACRGRILGVGAEQYEDDNGQKFETMPLVELVVYAREEAQDLAVYAAMLDIRLKRLEDALREKGIT